MWIERIADAIEALTVVLLLGGIALATGNCRARAVVLIRTFLSWSIVVEIEGRWPWQAPREGAEAASTREKESARTEV
jgi:hypothetical protein